MVKIYTVSSTRPDFIEPQKRCFERFLRDPYEFIVCDSAGRAEDSRSIKSICVREGLTYRLIPDHKRESGGVRFSYPLDYLTQEVIAKDKESDISVLIDSDMFLVKDFSFIEYMEGYEVAGVFQSRGRYKLDHQDNHVRYLWNALVLIDNKRIKNIDQLIWACSVSQDSPYYPTHLYSHRSIWSPLRSILQHTLGVSLRPLRGKIQGKYVDLGGATFFYLRDTHPRVRYIDWRRVKLESNNIDVFIPPSLQEMYRPFYNDLFGCDFLADGRFFHYRAGSNWNNMSEELMQQKTAFFKKIIRLAFEEGLPEPLPEEAVE